MKTKNIKQLIKDHYDELSATGQKLAKFVIDNYQQSIPLDSTELAKAAGVSNTAVIRFAKSLGFSGFLEYKNALKLEYTSTQKVYSYLSMMEPAGERGYISDYFSAALKDLKNFANSFDLKTLNNFCKEIINAENVYIMGIGSDEAVVTFLQNYLNVMGIKCIPVCQEGLTLRERLFLVNEKDVVILSAFPTLMEDEKWAAKYIKKQGAKLLVITDSEITANTLQADYHVCLVESSDVFFNSYIMPMAFCNALLLRLYELEPDKTTKAMKSYQDMLN